MRPLTRIVLTGGPCGGKSAAYKHVSERLRREGFDVYFVPETPTLLMQGGCSYPGIDGGERMLAFGRHLVQLQRQLEDSMTGIARSTGRPSVVFFDRGLLDVAAYVPGSVWHELLQANGWSEREFLERYDLVLHLVSVSVGAEHLYSHETNPNRTETAAEARELDAKVRTAWSSHSRQHIIGNAELFETKMQNAIDHVLPFVSSSGEAHKL